MREIECAANGPGFVLRDATRNVATFDFSFRNINAEFGRLPGTVVSNQPPKPWSPAAISAHANATEVVDFLAKVLRRNGLDNAGGPVISSINCVDRPGTQEWKNAAWVGTQMVYGQRKVGSRLRSYAAAKDVVAHEIFHGLTDKTSRLEYRGQSGALNESYSDIFGIIVSNINQANIAKWDWRLGEDLTGTGMPIRNLADPTKHNQPAHMNNYLRLPETREGDWGGVHWNSGIHNKAAHTILTTRRGGQFLFTATQVAAIFYLALTQSLSRTSDFSASRRAVELWARSLFRNDADRDVKVKAVSDAFAGVGIT